MPFCQQVHFTHSHNISKWHPGSRGGTGTTKRKWFVTLKSSFTIYEKEDVRLSLKHQLYKCMYSWLQLLSNRWYRGIELSKCVYLASMGVKIEHTVGVQNKDVFKMHI